MGLFNFLFNKQQKKKETLSVSTFIKKENYQNNITTDDRGPLLDCNLYIGEVILLNWLNQTDITKKEPGYFVFEFGINPIKGKQKLLSMGLLEKGNPSDSLSSLKVVELKEILSQNNQKVSGKKADLILRIKNNIDPDMYKNSVPTVFILTAAGENIINEYGIFIWSQQNRGLFQPIDFIEDQHATPPYENIIINMCKTKINQGDVTNFSNCEYELGVNYKRLNYVNYREHFLYSLLLEYFGFMDLNDNKFHFTFPHEWDSQRIQSKIIDEIDSYDANGDFLTFVAKSFIKFYSNKLPDFLLNEQDLSKILTDALELDPKKYHEKHLEYFNKRVPKYLMVY